MSEKASPRTRRKPAAADTAAEGAEPAAAPKRAPRARKAAPKATAKPRKPRKAAAKPKRESGKRGPGRPRFEPVNREDFAAIDAAIDEALKLAEKEEPLTPIERWRRDQTVIAARAMGLRPPTIAQQVGLSEAHVRRILDAHRERRADEPVPDSADILEDALEALELNIETVGLMASQATNAKGEPVEMSHRLGAMKTKHEMQIARLELLQAMGRVSTRPSDHLRDREVVELFTAMLSFLRGRQVPEDVIDALGREVLPARVVSIDQARGA